MRNFEFFTKFLIIWHPWDPWVCIRSALKPLETDMSDSSYCDISLPHLWVETHHCALLEHLLSKKVEFWPKNQLKSAYNTYFYKDWHCGTIVIKIVSIAGVGGSNNRSSSLGRNTSLFNHIANQDRTSLDKFKQVTRQSALSPQQNNGNTSDDRESCV